MRFVLFCVLWLSTAIASANPNAVVRVIVSDGSGQSMGSGTHLGGGFFVTAQHVVERSGVNATVRSPDGKIAEGRVVAIDSEWDLAGIVAESAAAWPSVKLAATYPQIGESVLVCGYGPGQHAIGGGKAVRYGGSKRNSSTADTLVVSCPVRSGDSGGAMFSPAGDLVGVIWGSDMSQTSVGTQVNRVRIFIETQCQGGRCPVPSFGSNGGGGRMQPVQPTPQPQQPANPFVQQQPSPIPNCPCDQSKMQKLDASLARVEQSLELLRQRLDSCEGKQGMTGPQGPAGKDASIDIDALVLKLQPIVEREVRKNLRVTVTQE